MKKKLLASILLPGVLAAALCTSPLQAAVRVYVGVPPPPAIVEKVPVAPSPNHIWVRGFHRWDGRAYVWAPGHFVVRPRPGAAWVAGHWVKHRRGWYWVDGRWRHR